MCSRDSQAQMLQGSAVLYAACKTLWGTIAGAGGGGGNPRALEIGAEINEFTCSTSPVLYRTRFCPAPVA